jgi:hypothetical protein
LERFCLHGRGGTKEKVKGIVRRMRWPHACVPHLGRGVAREKKKKRLGQGALGREQPGMAGGWQAGPRGRAGSRGRRAAGPFGRVARSAWPNLFFYFFSFF